MSAFSESQSSGFLHPFWIDLGAFKMSGPTIDWQHHVRGKRT